MNWALLRFDVTTNPAPLQPRSIQYLRAPAEPTPAGSGPLLWAHAAATTDEPPPPRVAREGPVCSVLPPPPTARISLSSSRRAPRPRECSCSSLLPLPSPTLPQIRARFPDPRDARGHSSPKAAGELASFRRRGPPGGNLSWSRLPPRLLSRRGAEAGDTRRSSCVWIDFFVCG